jgi:hypothetical protein
VDSVFSLTSKSFRTPLGLVETDTDLVDRLRQAGSGREVAPDDFAHRAEHSIEIQLVFLQHVLPRPFRIVPILCGSFHRQIHTYARAAEIPGVREVTEVLKPLLGQDTGKTLVVAGVDLCHIGPKFGHPDSAADLEPEARLHDEATLQALLNRDPLALWAEARRVRGQFHVCGFSALACLLEILPECRGRRLAYDLWHEAPTQSAVSFAAMEFSTERVQS